LCEGQEYYSTQDRLSFSLDVPSFIDLLKAGRYKTFMLPAFTPADIPELLKYRNETVLIRNFPFNPFSSYAISLAESHVSS
jgi:hypothetical protein